MISVRVLAVVLGCLNSSRSPNINPYRKLPHSAQKIVHLQAEYMPYTVAVNVLLKTITNHILLSYYRLSYYQMICRKCQINRN